MSEGTPAPRFDVARAVVWSAVVAVVTGVVAAAVLLPDRASEPRPADRLVQVPEEEGDAPPPPPASGLFERPIGALPDLPAVDAAGAAFRTPSLRGRWLVADFVFSHCSGTCPRLQSAMRELQDATAGDASLGFVSFSVDPARDTPERLAAWSASVGADPARWRFVRLEEPDVRVLMKDGLKVPAADELILHSNLFLLLDPEGRVVARYSPLEHANWREALLADLRILREGAGR